MTNQPIEAELKTLTEDIERMLGSGERVALYEHDVDVLHRALQALDSREYEIKELNALTIKLDEEVGNLKREIEARKAELQDAWRYQSEAEAALAKERIDSINRVYVFQRIDCVEFAIECAHDGPNEEYALYRVAMEATKRLRNCLTVYDESASDIPF